MKDDLSIGCDLGGTNLKVALVAGRNVLATFSHDVERARETASAAERSGAILDQIDRAVRAAVARAPRNAAATPHRTCVAVPGLLSDDRRAIRELSNYPELTDVPLADEIERRTGSAIARPVHLDADTNAGAVAVARLEHPDARRVLFVAIGTGLGAALVAGGRVVRASHHTVGQIAHLPLVPDGPVCACGSRGCAEAVLSAGAIVRRALEAGVPGEVAASAESLFTAATAGHPGAAAIFEELGERLGELLVVLARLFSPDRMVIGGGVSGAGELLLNPARRVMASRFLGRSDLRRDALVDATTLGPFAGAIGAALLA